MEKWLTEESTVMALLHFSGVSPPGNDDEDAQQHLRDAIAAAFRHRSRDKAMQLAEQVFGSRLEMELLNGFDLKGGTSGTIPQCQARLADECIPFAQMDAKDMEPTVTMLLRLRPGQELRRCQYMWADIVSAVLFEKLRIDCTQQGAQEGMESFRKNARQYLLGETMEIDRFLQAATGSEDVRLETIGPDELFRVYNIQSGLAEPITATDESSTDEK